MNDHSNASRAVTQKLKIMTYTLDNNRRVASRRIVKAAVLVALSVFEISNICQHWSLSLVIVDSDFSTSRAATDKPKETPYAEGNSKCDALGQTAVI